MKSNLTKISGIALALILLVSMLVSVIPVSAGTLQYTAVGTPGGIIPFNTIRPNVNLSLFAQSPDGKTMFVYDNVNFVLIRSTNSGGWWSTTNIGVGLPAATAMVDIVVSPSYATDTTVVIVSATTVYRSINGGANFGPIGAVVLPTATTFITSVDITDYYLGGQAILISYAETGAGLPPFGGVQLFNMTNLAWINQQCTRTNAETLKLVVTTAIDALNAATVVVTYVDQSGNAAEAAAAVVIPAGSIVGFEIAVALNGADTGAIDVTNVTTVGSLATTGAFRVVGGTVAPAVTLDNYGSYLITGAAAGTYTDAGVGHAINVLHAAFSPNHRADALVVALATDGTNTYMLYKMGSENWGATIQNAVMTIAYANATYGTITFPADYDWSANNRILASVCTPAGVTVNDDVFMVTGGLAVGASSFKDLNVRGIAGGGIAVRNVAIKGNYVGGKVMIGAYLAGTTTLVYTATDPSLLGAVPWPLAVKQPVGSYTAGQYATVAFNAATDDAYAMTQGAGAAFSKSIDSGATWNGIALFNLGAAAPPPFGSLGRLSIVDFATIDGKTMYFILFDDINADGAVGAGELSFLFKSANSGNSWEQVWSWRTVVNERLAFIGISPTYDKDSVVYVAQSDTRIWKSANGGSTFIGLTSPGTNITAFYVFDANTYYTGATGVTPVNGFYKNGRWTSPTLTAAVQDIEITADGKAIYISAAGAVNKSMDDGVSFAPYGIGSVGVGNAIKIDLDPDGKTLYASSNGAGTLAAAGIYRVADTPGALWTAIDTTFMGVGTTVAGAAVPAAAADAVTATFGVGAVADVLNVQVLPGSAITVTTSAGAPGIVYTVATASYAITAAAGAVVIITNAGTGATPANAILTVPGANIGTITFSKAAPGADADGDVVVPAVFAAATAATQNLSLPDPAIAASVGTVVNTPVANDIYCAPNGTLYVAWANNTGAGAAFVGGGLRRSVNPKGATTELRGFETVANAVGFDLPGTATGMALDCVNNDVYMTIGNVPATGLGGQGYASNDCTATVPVPVPAPTGRLGARVAAFSDTAAVAVKTLDPKDGVVTTGTSVSLSWAKVDAPVAITYVYQIATDPDFANCIDLDNNAVNGLNNNTNFANPAGLITTTGTSVTVFGLVPGTQYWWRVRILNAGNNAISGIWSPKMSFTPELGGPTLKSPEYGATDVALRPTFSWLAITGAEGYELQMATNQFFAMPTAKGPLSHTTWTWEEDLAYGTTYYWRVRAIKGGSTYSPWSESVFTIGVEPTPAAPPVVITQAAAAPVPTIVIPTPTIQMPPTQEPAKSPITPAVIWAIIIIGAILVIAVIVLIVRTRRVP